MTLADVNTDAKVVKREMYDADVMDALLCDKRFSMKDLGNLSRYKRGRKHGSEVEVIYHYAKGWEEAQMGRLYPHGGQGLQSFPFDMRNPLLEKYYWDCDMANCHYVILAALGEEWGLRTNAIQQYIANRDAELLKVSSNRGIAKTAFLKVAYGGNIKLANEHYNDDGIGPDGDLTLIRAIEKEMGAIVEMCWSKYSRFQSKVMKKPNPKFSLFAVVLQTEERKCLLAMDSYMRKNKRSVDVLIHDGGSIRKLDDEKEFPDELLRGAEEYIFEKTGYKHSLLIKQWCHNFTMPEDENLVPEYVLINDSYAAQTFIKLMGNHIKKDSGKVWVFDARTGLWSFDEDKLRGIVSSFGKKLVFKQMTDSKVRVYDYSGCVADTKNLLIKLPDFLPDSTGWFRARVHSDIGKLLFQDGIYTFETGVFTKGFDENIVFTGRMPRAFPTRIEENVAWVRSFFDEVFETEPKSKDHLLHNLMRAAMGDFLRKKLGVGTGFRSSGKGITVEIIKTGFGELCSAFNGNNLLYRRGGSDDAAELGWALAITNARFAFASEIKVAKEGDTPVIDGALIKQLASGGDEIEMRNTYGRKCEKHINKSTIFLFAQDVPQINPSDACEGVIPFRFSYAYVDEPKRRHEKKRDDDVKKKAIDPAIGDAMFWLLVDVHAKWVANGRGELAVDDEMLLARAELMNDNNYEEIIDRRYEITNNHEDMVSFTEIADYLKAEGVHDNKTKIGRELTALGLAKKVCKVGKAAVLFRTGLKQRG